MVLDEQSSSNTQTAAPRLRSACNCCRQLKVRCSGGNPCRNCANSDAPCDYGVSNRLGRPKGAKNRQPPKGHILAPAPLISAPHGGRHPTTTDTILWLSPPADKRAFTPDPWPLTTATATATATDIINQQQHQPPRHQRHYTLELPGWPTPPDLADSMPPMHSTGHDPFGLDDGGDMDAAVLSWAPSPQDIPSFFDARNQMLCGETQKGWPLSIEPPTPSVSATDDVSRLAAAYGPPPCSYGDFVEPSLKGLDTAPPSEAGAGAGGAVECSCLQRHMDLLCSLKRPQLHRPSSTLLHNGSSSAGGLPVDTVLQNAQEAWEACRAVTECHDSLDNHDHEVILLLVMCLRTVVSQIQQLPWQATSDGGGSLGFTQDEFRDDGIRSRESSSPLENRSGTGAGSCGGGGVPILVGEFEVCGDDKELLLGSLRMIGLRKVAAGLTMLRQLIDRKKAKPRTQQPRMNGADGRCLPTLMMDNLQDASDLKHVERMMDGLMHSIKVVMNSRGVDDRYLGL